MNRSRKIIEALRGDPKAGAAEYIEELIHTYSNYTSRILNCLTAMNFDLLKHTIHYGRRVQIKLSHKKV